MLRRLTFIFALMGLAATSASATHLSDLQGSVLVNNRAVAANIELAPGDRVRVVSGSVRIVYNNGVIINVAPGQTIVVLKKPPEDHVEGAILPPASAETGVFALGGTAASIGMVAGGAAVAGGAGLAVALSQKGTTPPKPLSP